MLHIVPSMMAVHGLWWQNSSVLCKISRREFENNDSDHQIEKLAPHLPQVGERETPQTLDVVGEFLS